MDFLHVLKLLFDIVAYSALFVLLYAFMFVRSGGEIHIRYNNYDDEDYDDYEN